MAFFWEPGDHHHLEDLVEMCKIHLGRLRGPQGWELLLLEPYLGVSVSFKGGGNRDQYYSVREYPCLLKEERYFILCRRLASFVVLGSLAFREDGDFLHKNQPATIFQLTITRVY